MTEAGGKGEVGAVDSKVGGLRKALYKQPHITMSWIGAWAVAL